MAMLNQCTNGFRVKSTVHSSSVVHLFCAVVNCCHQHETLPMVVGGDVYAHCFLASRSHVMTPSTLAENYLDRALGVKCAAGTVT